MVLSMKLFINSGNFLKNLILFLEILIDGFQMKLYCFFFKNFKKIFLKIYFENFFTLIPLIIFRSKTKYPLS